METDRNAPEGEEIGSGTYYKFLSVNEMYYEYVSGTHTQWVWWPFKKKTVKWSLLTKSQPMVQR